YALSVYLHFKGIPTVPYIDIDTVLIDDYFSLVVFIFSIGYIVGAILADQFPVTPHFPFVFRDLAPIHVLVVIGPPHPAPSWRIIVLYDGALGQIEVVLYFLAPEFVFLG